MAPGMEVASRRVRVAALLLIAGLAAGPVATHVYWMLGGTWGLYTLASATKWRRRAYALSPPWSSCCSSPRCWSFWRGSGCGSRRIVSDRAIRFFAWALAAVFLVETLAAFTWSRGEELWWMYGPVSLVIAVLALVVAGSGGAGPLPPAAPDAALALKEASWPRELFPSRRHRRLSRQSETAR